MIRCKRLFSAVLLLCFALSVYSPPLAFAQDQKPAAGAQPAAQSTSTGSADSDDLNDEDERNSDLTTGSALDITTDSAIDLTTGQAIDSTTEQAIDSITGQAIKGTTGQAIDQTTKSAIEAAPPKKNEEESLWYRKQNPMKKEHQKLLWDYCKKRSLDYIDMLSLISLESNFNEKCTTGNYFGYFQLSKGNCSILASALKTKNKPLDGAININWGTTYFSWIMQDKRLKGLTGKKKRDVALSIYQRGTGGYDKSGLSTKFLNNFYKKRKTVCSWYGIES